jgi:hypothetical protein
VLVFAVVIGSTAVIVVFGAVAIQDSRGQLGSNTAENTMTQLDSQASLVALGDAGVQRVSLGAEDGSYSVNESAGWMNVTIDGETGPIEINQRMGSVVYNGDDQNRIAYQGGGVWRGDGSGNAVMVSPPEFHYRDATLTLPLVTINDAEQINGDVLITPNETTQYYPNETNGLNPLQSGSVTVTVQSEYYEAWGTYFETRTGGDVTYDDADNEVTLDLVVNVQQTTATEALGGLSSGTLTVAGNGGVACGDNGGPKFYTDSYDSSLSADYCTQYDNGNTGSNGNITFGGDIDYQGNANFNGNIRSGGTVDITGNADINGDIYWTDDFNPGGSATYDNDEQISGVRTQPGINDVVASNGQRIADDNDNDDANDGYDAITSSPDPEVNFGGVGSDVEIENAGQYHLHRLEIDSGEELTLDTSDGDITIAVDEYVDIAGTLDVDGDNDVRIYVRDMNSNGESVSWGTGGTTRTIGLNVDDGEVLTEDQNSTQLRFYGNNTFNTSIEDSQVTGVIWTPVGSSGTGGFRIRQSDVYGAVVSGDVRIENKGRIHYDEALGEEEIVSSDETVTRITYIHFSTNAINITSQ